MRWVVLLFATSACQVVFKLDSQPADGPGDGAPDSLVDLHDEDGDGVVDALDNCPGIPNENQSSNEEVGGVGTVCDPAIGRMGDRLVHFESFATGFGDVAPVGTALQLANDGVETVGPADGTNVSLAITIPTSARTGLAVELGFIEFDFGTTGNGNSLTIAIASQTGFSCLISENDVSTFTSVGRLFGSQSDNTELTPVITLNKGVPQRLVVGAHDQTGAFCQCAGGRAVGFGDMEGDVTITIRAVDMRARLDYLAVYDTDAP